MSCRFAHEDETTHEDETIWFPASRVARLYLGQLRVVEDLLGERSGVGEIEADECYIDGNQFLEFVIKFGEYYTSTTHDVLRSLLYGTFVTSCALLGRINSLDELHYLQVDAGLAEDVRKLSRRMPRT